MAVRLQPRSNFFLCGRYERQVPADEKIDQRTACDQKEKPPVPGPVKHVTANQQKQVTNPNPIREKKPVNREDCKEEE